MTENFSHEIKMDGQVEFLTKLGDYP